MQLREAERIFFESVTSNPLAIQPVVMQAYATEDNATPENDVETYTTAFVVHPAKGEYIFTSSCELRKIILKPPRYNIVQTVYVKPSPKGTTDPDGNTVDNCFVTKWEVDQTQFDAIGVDGGEVVIFFRARIGNFWLTGEEGRFLVTKNRIAEIDLTDFDGRGYYAESGERIEWEILAVDVTSLRLLKSFGYQSLVLPFPILYGGVAAPKVEGSRLELFRTGGYFRTDQTESYLFSPDDIGYMKEALINSGSPSFLILSSDAVGLFDNIQPVIKSGDAEIDGNTNPVMEVMMGYPVSIIFGGLKFPRNCKIKR